MTDGIIRQKIRLLDAGPSPSGFVDLYVKDNQYWFVNSSGVITPLYLGETAISEIVANSILAGQGLETSYDVPTQLLTISIDTATYNLIQNAVQPADLAGYQPLRDTLSKIETGWMQYQNSATQTTTALSPSFTELVVDTDFNSFANGLFTKLSTTRIQTDFSGWVRVSFKAEVQGSSNDRPIRCVVVKNGSQVAVTSQRNAGKSNTNRYQSVSQTSILNCEVDDTFSLGFGNAESADTATIFENQALFTVEAIRRA